MECIFKWVWIILLSTLMIGNENEESFLSTTFREDSETKCPSLFSVAGMNTMTKRNLQ